MDACEAARAPASVEDDVGGFGADYGLDRGCHHLGIGGTQPEAVARLRQAELPDEDLRKRVVVVLPGVDDDLVDPDQAEPDRERRTLHELRAVSDDGENLHGAGRLDARSEALLGSGARRSRWRRGRPGRLRS